MRLTFSFRHSPSSSLSSLCLMGGETSPSMWIPNLSRIWLRMFLGTAQRGFPCIGQSARAKILPSLVREKASRPSFRRMANWDLPELVGPYMSSRRLLTSLPCAAALKYCMTLAIVSLTPNSSSVKNL